MAGSDVRCDAGIRLDAGGNCPTAETCSIFAALSGLGSRQTSTRHCPAPTTLSAARSSASWDELYRATIGDGNALAVELNLFRHTYDTLRPHQALDARTPRAPYLAVEHCGERVAFGGPATDWEVLT